MGDMPGDNILKIDAHWDFPSSPRLKLHLFTTVGMGSIPGTKIPGASWCGQKKKKKKKKEKKNTHHGHWPRWENKEAGSLSTYYQERSFLMS